MDIKGVSCDQAFSPVHGAGSGQESPTMKRRRYSSFDGVSLFFGSLTIITGFNVIVFRF